ncbi:thioredoxin family protein [Okeania hirsuta]|uniref:Thioredoxin family protein n=2 Tax=Microcoleaceae TaxID=1892252 RepID=A0A3N6RFW3_9CYAN|nr:MULTISPECIES: thioredoxin family protein [Okeania]NES88443.1 thioredoxin family protein [Okeania sp. SIO2B9]NET76214.1 thioredoxin family protein [Okeania sp. SIO1F9]RQH28284.1 thioredoxin family protein [Okeania hirsuta]
MSLTEMTGTEIDNYAPDFELPGVDGEVHHLARYLENFKVVCVIFLSNQCPEVDLYIERIKQLQKDFQNQGVIIIGMNANDATISPNPKDSFEKMKEFAANNQLNFPYIRDVTQDVAESFGVDKTPEAFLLDREGKLRYRGRIDDNVNQPEAVKVAYLHQAIAQLLQDEEVTPSHTEVVGCSIKWRRKL